MDKYLLDLRIAQAQEKLGYDIEQALGSPTEQYERLARLIEAAAPTRPRKTELRKDIEVEVVSDCWVNHFPKRPFLSPLIDK